jgi:hypothetical protein
VKSTNRAQIINKAGRAIDKRMAAIKDPTVINPQTTKPTINVSIINLNAAFLAFPECFMPAQGKA